MKTCPICHAGAFDDAQICFGCLQRYGEHEERGVPIASSPSREIASSTTGRCREKSLIEAGKADGQLQVRSSFISAEKSVERGKSLQMNEKHARQDVVIRFELPGFVPEAREVAAETGISFRYRGGVEKCSFLRNDTSKEDLSNEMVVRVAPDVFPEQRKRSRAGYTQGNHARVDQSGNTPVPLVR